MRRRLNEIAPPGQLKRSTPLLSLMIELVQQFSRALLATLSGTMIIFGSALFADRLTETHNVMGLALDTVNNNGERLLFTGITAVTAYIVGTINVAASNFLFTFQLNRNKEELILISHIESLQQPQLLKEMVDLINLKRSLIGFSFPLVYFGLALAADRYLAPESHVPILIAGILLATAGVLSPFLAARIVRILLRTEKELLNGKGQNSVSD